jgi:hypothetical protein
LRRTIRIILDKSNWLHDELRLLDSVEVKRFFFKFPRPGSAATLGDDQHLSTPSFLLNLGGKYSKIPILGYFYTL